MVNDGKTVSAMKRMKKKKKEIKIIFHRRFGWNALA